MAKTDDTPTDDQADTSSAETPDAAAAEPAPQSYRIVRGVNYPSGAGEKRAEPGDVVDDLPEESIGWLLDDGAIEKA